MEKLRSICEDLLDSIGRQREVDGFGRATVDVRSSEVD
jgi:hypothetical protein